MDDKPRDLHLFADVHEYRVYFYTGGLDLAFYHGADADAETLIERIMPLQLRDIYLHGDVELNRTLWNALEARQRNPFSSRIYRLEEAEAPLSHYAAVDGKPECRHCNNGMDAPVDLLHGACPKCGRDDFIPF